MKWLLGALAALLLLILVGGGVYYHKTRLLDLSAIRHGDIIFARVEEELDGETLAWLIPDGVNHVGIVSLDSSSKRLMVLEAWKQVRLTPLEDFLVRCNGHVVIVKRFKKDAASAEQMDSAIDWGNKHVGYPYDRRFDWSTDYRFYNMELVAKALDRGTVYSQFHLVPAATYFNGRIENRPAQVSLIPDDRDILLPDRFVNIEFLETVTSGVAPSSMTGDDNGPDPADDPGAPPSPQPGLSNFQKAPPPVLEPDTVPTPASPDANPPSPSTP